MKLETMKIRRYKSVEDCEITNIGQFNVLIGKNNSGKSNILSAIDIFLHLYKMVILLLLNL